MAGDAASDALRVIVLRAAYAIAQGSTVVRLDGDLVAAGLPPSQGDGSKAKRAEGSVAAIPDDRLRDVAVGMLNGGAWLQLVAQLLKPLHGEKST